jgi:hypothetical protein
VKIFAGVNVVFMRYKDMNVNMAMRGTDAKNRASLTDRRTEAVLIIPSSLDLRELIVFSKGTSHAYLNSKNDRIRECKKDKNK